MRRERLLGLEHRNECEGPRHLQRRRLGRPARAAPRRPFHTYLAPPPKRALAGPLRGLVREHLRHLERDGPRDAAQVDKRLDPRDEVPAACPISTG